MHTPLRSRAGACAALPSLAVAGLVALAVQSASAATLPAATPAELIAAINSANATPEADTIELTAGATYTFTAVDNWWYGPNALPPIASPITIEGHGATLAIGGDPVRLRFFYIGADPTSPRTYGYNTPGAGNLTLRQLTITGGIARGGNGGGGGAGMGGALFNQGTLALDSVTLRGNRATGGAGSIGGASGNGVGGGIGSDCLGYFGGSGGFGGGGGGGGGANGGVESIGGNGGPVGFGGGGGSAGSSGGSGNGGGGAAMGGAIFNHGGLLTSTNTTFSGNAATGGSSTAGSGSGLGAAIFNLNGSVSLIHCTVAGNSVAGSTGYPYTVAAGALYNLGYRRDLILPPATVTLANCIVTGTTGGSDLVNNCPAKLSGDEAFRANAGAATLTFSGPNLISSRADSGTASASGTAPLTSAPLLGTLGDYGGGTWTCPLLPGSPAINAGAASAVATDQRGLPRVGAPDLGAFEVQIATYTAWASISFSATELADLAISGATADPDGAGITNLMRYALDLPARGPVAATTTAAFDGGTTPATLALSFTVRATADDLLYEVLSSQDLMTWNLAAPYSANGTKRTELASVPVPAGATRFFLRLQVTPIH